MNLHIFTTGEGSSYGLAMVPVIKVSSHTSLAERRSDLIDLYAWRIATGLATVKDVGWEISAYLSRGCQRQEDAGRALGLANALVPFQPSSVT